MIVPLRCLFPAIAGCLLATSAAAETFTERAQTVTGQVTDASSKVLIDVLGSDAAGCRRTYLVDVAYTGDQVPGAVGTFTLPVRYYPGTNLVTVTSATGKSTRQPKLSVQPPSMHVHLNWAGNDLDYDLYVNDLWYGHKSNGLGTLDTDAYGGGDTGGAGNEDVSFPSVPDGVYKIYVNYYSNHNHAGQANETTASIIFNGNTIYTAKKTLSTPTALGASLAGDGKSVWNVATIVVHGQKAGGFQVVDDTGAVADIGYRDIFAPADGKPLVIQKGQAGIFPATNFQVTSVTGPAGAGRIVLPLGRAAQFTALGTLNNGSSNTEQRAVLGKFNSTNAGAVSIDDLGVATAIAPGTTSISAYAVGGIFVDAVDIKLNARTMTCVPGGVGNLATGGDLDQVLKQVEGAFIPVNDDDDDYDGAHSPDKDQAGKIPGEDDLLPLTLVCAGPSIGGTITVHPTASVKLYRDQSRTTLVTAATPLDFAPTTTLYAEGVAAGTGTIDIDYKTAGGTVFPKVDQLLVRVFAWEGPLNVPEHGRYRYTVTGVKTGTWMTPDVGTVFHQANPLDWTIEWKNGPAIGRAIFAASSQYSWGLNVDIVYVKVDTIPGFAPFIPSNVYTVQDYFVGASPFPGPGLGAPFAAIKWNAQAALSGPSYAGVAQRGVDRIEVGVIQNYTAIQAKGTYAVAAPSTLTSSLQNHRYVDYIDGTPGPWYDGGPNDHDVLPPGGGPGFINLFSGDKPSAGVPRFYKQLANLAPAGDGPANRLDWSITFDLYVAASCLDTQNDADKIYTPSAHAIWNDDFHSAIPIPATGAMNVTVPAAWTSIRSARVADPVTTGNPTNTDLGIMTWSSP